MNYDVLLIDDEESLRKLYASFLKNADYSFSVAKSGMEGLKLLDENRYQLILLDLKMPGMDGAETLREIRKMGVNIPVYIVTAFPNEFFDRLKNIREDGIEFQILNKPLDKNHLLEALESVIINRLSDKKQFAKLRLYIVANNKRTQSSISRLHEIFQGEFMDAYSLEVIDVIDNPVMASEDNILATPTLLRMSPEPIRRIIGDFTNRDMVLHNLGFIKT